MVGLWGGQVSAFASGAGLAVEMAMVVSLGSLAILALVPLYSLTTTCEGSKSISKVPADWGT